MGTYTQNSLDTLREKVDLVELLSTYVSLKRHGSTYKGLCPFHQEKSPSFIVRVGDGHYHCFGCGAHGDGIAFLREHLKVSFSEAVEMLSERFGVTMEKTEGDSRHKGPSRQIMREALAQATDFYHVYLLHTEEGKRALEYLYARGLDLSFIRQFKVGMSPSMPKLFQEAMRAKKIDPKIMELVGLTKGGRDFFFDRIMFPITDGMGHVIGFSGRKLKERAGGPKYVNTPETPLFKKSKVLFGLAESRRRIAKEKRAIIVEGQIDALRLIASGFNLTVAGQGTAFGQEHAAQVIALGVESVYLALDGDQAGADAAVKIGNLFQKEGVEVFIVNVPQGSDPDTFILEMGAPAFQKLLTAPRGYLEFLIAHYSNNQPLTSPAKKHQLVMKISEQIRAWEHPLMVHESLRKLAQLTQIPEAVLNGPEEKGEEVTIKKWGSITQTDIDPDRILEADALRWLLLASQDVMAIAQANLKEECFRNGAARRLFNLIMTALEEGGEVSSLTLAQQCDQVEDNLFLSEILQKRINLERSKEGMVETVSKLLTRHWMERREAIKLKIQSGRLNDEEISALAKEFDELKGAPPQVVVPESP